MAAVALTEKKNHAMSLASLLGTALPKRVHSIDSPKSAESKKSISFSANNPDENNAGVNPPPLQPVTSASYNLGIPDLPPEGDSYADEYLEDEFVESPIKIEPGAAKADVLSMSGRTTKEVRAQVARLQAWEEQLQTYSDQLTETGWRSWKRGAVTSVMNARISVSPRPEATVRFSSAVGSGTLSGS